MKVLFISPEDKKSIFAYRKQDTKALFFPKLSFPIIAAYTPADVEIKIVDECVEDIDFNIDVDLVGITIMTCLAPRAYEIAARFRARGIKVVLGGIHVSMCPEEAKKHADCIVVGEAEKTWPMLIEDFKRGGVKPVYENKGLSSLEGLREARTDLLNRKNYWTTNCVHTSRGCPFNCDFCSVTTFGGNQYRLRPVEEVVKEIQKKIKSNKGVIHFNDDNIVGNKAYSKQLFKALIPLKIKWGGQASLTMVNDQELIDLALRSGCFALFFGVESISEKNLISVNKKFNKVEKFSDEFKKLHDKGILIHAGMMFGFDNDDESVFERTVDFLSNNRIEMAMFNILTPLPGTRFYKKMDAEGRIIDRDWAHYDARHVVFKPSLMTPDALQKGFFWAYHNFYSSCSIARRILPNIRTYPKKRVLERTIEALYINYALRRIVKRWPRM